MTGYRAALVAALALTVLGCRWDRMTDATPEPSPSAEATPTPAPSVAPSAAPTAPPTTQPPSTPPPAAASCRLEPMPDNGNCSRGSAAFSSDVEKAIDEVVRMYPGVFDLTDWRDCGRAYRCYKVVNGKAFERRMVERLEAMGYCAKCDEECGVKDTNRFNEQYDLMVADGYLRRGEGAYRATCYPAAF